MSGPPNMILAAVVLTRDVAEWLTNLRIDAIPASAVERASASILDTLGVTIAGLDEPAARIAARLAASDRAAPVASQLGTSLATSMESAAFVNGVAGHALDYDDVSYAVIGHPSIVVLPTALAVGQATGASGASVLAAYIGGVEVMAKLARAMGEQHYLAGWHTTATIGCVASAATAARLLCLDVAATQVALAIAASSAAGLRGNFGTMTKPYHAGHAGRCGVNAARLAAAGFTAEARVFEGPTGFFASYGGDPARAGAVGPSLGQPFELESPGLGIKRYPCCYGTHRALDGMLSLIEQHGLGEPDVERAMISAPPGELAPLIHPHPTSGLEGKFSMPYVLAAALVDGAVGLGSFSDAMVARDAIQGLLPRIDVHAFEPDGPEAVSGLAGGDGHVRVAVQTRAGDRVQTEVRYARGAPENPVSIADVIDKFRDCTLGRLSPAQATRAIECVLRLRSADGIGSLTAALVPGASDN
jgi:2-methylcitrate dehydratase PrpD